MHNINPLSAVGDDLDHVILILLDDAAYDEVDAELVLGGRALPTLRHVNLIFGDFRRFLGRDFGW